MIASRRALPSRYEFRFGTRELAALACGVALVCALTFVVGLLVGRSVAPPAGPSATVRAATDRAAAPTTGPAGAAAPRGQASPGVTPARTEEQLTFYKTLTAPTTDLPAVAPPAVEEHLVPKGDPAVTPAPRPVAPAPPPAKPASPPVARAPAARDRRPPPAPAPRVEPAPPRSRVASAGAASGIAFPWTVQVSSFRSRALADELRARLAARGLDAYIVPVVAQEGRVRYRVRVGAFGTRSEAERVAAELRAERTLGPFVTPRSR